MKIIIFKLSALVIVILSSCSPKVGRIMKNNCEFNSYSVSCRQTIGDSAKYENKKGGLVSNICEDSVVIFKTTSQKARFINERGSRNKNLNFVYSSSYQPKIIKPKAVISNRTASVKASHTNSNNQNNQYAYITLGLLSLGLVTLNWKKLKNKLL